MSEQTRISLWTQILNEAKPRTVAEIGVWKGDFAASILTNCPSVEEYFMVDPWTHLRDWNKPYNVSQMAFEQDFEEAIKKTNFAAHKRQVLRGTTKDVISQIPDESLDFAYIDGDHTLRGITIDLIQVLPKIAPNGVIGGDDFFRDPSYHPAEYEPSLACPFAVYFAEAMNLPITALPFGQFLIEKVGGGFRLDDVVGKYDDLSLKSIFKVRGVTG